MTQFENDCMHALTKEVLEADSCYRGRIDHVVCCACEEILEQKIIR